MENESTIELINKYFRIKNDLRIVEKNLQKLAEEIMKRMNLPITDD